MYIDTCQRCKLTEMNKYFDNTKDLKSAEKGHQDRKYWGKLEIDKRKYYAIFRR